MMLLKPNRRRSIAAKNIRGGSWCPRCDANRIGEVGKCSVCGYMRKSKKKVPKLDSLEQLMEG